MLGLEVARSPGTGGSDVSLWPTATVVRACTQCFLFALIACAYTAAPFRRGLAVRGVPQGYRKAPARARYFLL